ncbi:MAG: hypothetical protein SF123_01760 [Chloroflexota bacterium]|nr:hypothetical protein [Chloroflexota bacterium]
MIDRLLRLLALFTLMFAAVAAARTLGTSMPLPMQLAYSEIKDAVAHIRLADAERGIAASVLRLTDADTQKAPLFAGWLDHDHILFFSTDTERRYFTWSKHEGWQPLNDLPLTCRLLESQISLRSGNVACTTFDQQSVMIQRGGEDAWEFPTTGTLLGSQLSADGHYLLLVSLVTREVPWRIFEVIDVQNRERVFSHEAELLLSGNVLWSANGHWLTYGCNPQQVRQLCLLDLSTVPPQVLPSSTVALIDYFVRSPDDIDYLLIRITEMGSFGGSGVSTLEVQSSSATLRLYQSLTANESIPGARWSPDGALVLFATENALQRNFLVARLAQPDHVWSLVRGSRVFVGWRPCPEAAC